MHEFILRSDDDAYELLQKVVANDFDNELIDIKFDGWPKLNIHLTGKQYNSTLTPSLMQGFIELQRGINRSYCLVRYNTPNTRVLSKAERKELEIQVKVGKGSTTTSVDLQGLLTNISEQVISKMDPTTLAITIVCLALIWAGKGSYGMYLEHRRQARETEVKSEEQKELLKNQVFLSEQETKRLEILSSAIVNNAKVASLSQVANDSKASLLKGVTDTETVTIQGIDIEGDLAGELAKNARRSSIDIRIDGLFRILNVDSSNTEEFKVRLRNIETKDEFTAQVQDKSLDNRYIKALQYGEWSRTPIELMINAKSIDDDIRHATVISAFIPK